MDRRKVFQDRNISGICEYLLNYCQQHINSTSTPDANYVRSLHTFLPTLLVYIFGSPTIRGWIQTETQAVQDESIERLLSVNGHFFQALVRLSSLPQYSYDLVTESLPSDVQNLLSSGSIHLLPSVYRNCTHQSESSNQNSVHLRAAATLQSTLTATTSGGSRTIRFNMLQFYLYYFVSIPTWPPLAAPLLPAYPHNTFGVQNPSNYSNQAMNSQVYPYGTLQSSIKPNQNTTTINNHTGSNPVYSSFNTNTTTTINPSATNTNSINMTPRYQIQGNLRSIRESVYTKAVEDYLARLIPINSSNAFPDVVGTFFLDACLELWIRTPWIKAGKEFSLEYMHYISLFVKYVVRNDLRHCLANENSLFYYVYKLTKNELYLLISRFAFNWNKQDDYLQVMELWSIWAAPWRLGAIPRSAESTEYAPIAQHWGLFVLDNIPFYFFLVDIILLRTSLFGYHDTIQPASTQLVAYVDTCTIRGQLRILYRLINVLHAHGLVDFLALVEKSLEMIHLNSFNIIAGTTKNPLKQLSVLCYGTDTMSSKVHEKILDGYKILVELEAQPTWKPKGLYSSDIQPRSELLLRTLSSIHAAILRREAMANSGQTARTRDHIKQLKDAYDYLAGTFNVTGTNHLTAQLGNANATSSQFMANGLVQRPKYKPKLAGLGENGCLTEEEKIALLEGRMVCSDDNIPILGIRARTHINSYEIPELARLSLRADDWLNERYDQYIPERLRPKSFPKHITVRPLAHRVTFVYTAVFVSVFIYLFCKIVF